MKHRAGQVSASAKVILMGEHSAVYGYPAVAAPVKSMRVHARASESEGPAWDGPIARAIEVALEFAGHAGAKLKVTTESNVPQSRGLGSSAAAAGAVIAAICDLYDAPLDPEQHFELTQEAERVAHGTPSGLDARATAAEGPIYFQDGKATPLEVNLDAWLVIADSGAPGSTLETVAHIRKTAETEKTKAIIAKLGELADAASRDLAGTDARALGVRMIRAHELLATLGVSTAQLDQLVGRALEAGALGAKLTGGGGGGCVIALCATENNAQVVAEALRAAGAQDTWVDSLLEKEDAQ